MFDHEVKDITLAPSGLEKIEWAYRNMPVLRAIEAELIDKQPFKGLKISVSVHVEAKTLSFPPFLLGELCCLGKRGIVLVP